MYTAEGNDVVQLPSLPVELIRLIYEYAHIQSCATLCAAGKLGQRIATPLLYGTTLELSNEDVDSTESLRRAILVCRTLVERPDLARTVTGLHMNAEATRERWIALIDIDLRRYLLGVWQQITRDAALAELLWLSAIDLPVSGPSCLILILLHCSNITRLKIYGDPNIYGYHSTYSTIMSDIHSARSKACVWPDVEIVPRQQYAPNAVRWQSRQDFHRRIGEPDPLTQARIHSHWFHTSCITKVTDLHMTTADFEIYESLHGGDRFSPLSVYSNVWFPHLRTLKITGAKGDLLEGTAEWPCTSSLESLTLDEFGGPLSGATEFVTKFTNLRSLTIKFAILGPTGDIEENVAAFGQGLVRNCRMLEHLSLHLDLTFTPRPSQEPGAPNSAVSVDKYSLGDLRSLSRLKTLFTPPRAIQAREDGSDYPSATTLATKLPASLKQLIIFSHGFPGERWDDLVEDPFVKALEDAAVVSRWGELWSSKAGGVGDGTPRPSSYSSLW